MAMPQGSGNAFNVANTGMTPSVTGTISRPILPGYVEDVLRIILELAATGEPVSFPDPIGAISRFNLIYGGNLLIERAEDGKLFIVTRYGDIAGPLVGLGGYSAPSFNSVSMSTTPTVSTNRLYIGPTGLPIGTLPSTMSYAQTGAGLPGIAPNPNVMPVVPIAPPVIPPTEPESSGISLLTIAGLAGALWFAAR